MTFSFRPRRLVALAHDRRFGQHAGGFLERCGRDERVGRQRCLGNTQQHVLVGRRQLACGRCHAVVGFQQLRTLHLLADDVVGVAGFDDLHAAQHLANDHLDVLVVDLHALQTVHVLHFVDDVARQRFDTQQAQDVLRIGRAVDDASRPCSPPGLRAPGCCLSFGNQVFVLVAVHVGDLQALLALGLLAERRPYR